MRNFFENTRTPLIKVKEQMKEAIEALLSARTDCLKAMIELDGFRNFFSVKHATKDQIIKSISETQKIASTISAASVWNISKKDLQVCPTVDISDKQLFDQVIVETCKDKSESISLLASDVQPKSYKLEEMFIES
mmetsp:Transcript_10925/g.12278  ORF Transcript_10925/g.12278 Transcript_10925/m.12278 type:complete len:135 (+) Transcript_10925:928-1332(+)